MLCLFRSHIIQNVCFDKLTNVGMSFYLFLFCSSLTGSWNGNLEQNIRTQKFHNNKNNIISRLQKVVIKDPEKYACFGLKIYV